MMCQKCGKNPVALEYNLKGKYPLRFVDLYCVDCLKDYEQAEAESNGEKCCDCGVEMLSFKELMFRLSSLPFPRDRQTEDDLHYRRSHGSYCLRCFQKRSLEAKAKGLCSECWVNPQADYLNRGGKKTDFCWECGRKWNEMLEAMAITDKLNEKSKALFKKDLEEEWARQAAKSKEKGDVL